MLNYSVHDIRGYVDVFLAVIILIEDDLRCPHF